MFEGRRGETTSAVAKTTTHKMSLCAACKRLRHHYADSAPWWVFSSHLVAGIVALFAGVSLIASPLTRSSRDASQCDGSLETAALMLSVFMMVGTVVTWNYAAITLCAPDTACPCDLVSVRGWTLVASGVILASMIARAVIAWQVYPLRDVCSAATPLFPIQIWLTSIFGFLILCGILVDIYSFRQALRQPRTVATSFASAQEYRTSTSESPP